MDQDPGKIESSLAALAERERRNDRHATAEELVAYHAEELEPTEHETIQAHLAICGECTQLLLDLASFRQLEPPDDVETISDEQLREDLAALTSRAQEHDAPAMRVLAFDRRERRLEVPRQTTTAAGWRALAAALAVLALGLGWWGLTLRQQLAELTAQGTRPESPPRLLYAIHDLEALGRGPHRGAAAEIRPPAEAQFLLLNLALVETRTFAAYRVALADPAGELLWTEEVPGISAYGHLALELPTGFLRAGEHTIRLHGLTDGKPELLATYRLPIAYD